MSFKYIFTAFMCCGSIFANSAHAENINNETIVTLVRAGLSEGLVIEKINSESCNYDVSTDKIIALKQLGVSDPVIAAMVRRCATLGQQRGIAGDDASPDPAVRHSPGIYSFENWLDPTKMQIIRPTKASGVKTTGNGSLIFPFMIKLVLPGSTSHLQIPVSLPEFYFYFNVSDEKVSDFGSQNSVAAQSPDEFSLVKFQVKGQDRELNFGKTSFYGGISIANRRGVDPKYTIHYESEELSKGAFKIKIPKQLDPGEYAFIFTGANGASRIYDFTVLAAAVEKK